MPIKQLLSATNQHTAPLSSTLALLLIAIFAAALTLPALAESLDKKRWQCAATTNGEKNGWDCTEQSITPASNLNTTNSKQPPTPTTCTAAVHPDASDDNLASFNFAEQSELPIKTSAKNVALKNGQVIFEQDVEFEQGSITLSAEHAVLDNAKQTIALQGNIRIKSIAGEIKGDSATIDLATNQSEIANASYTLGQQQARGNAALVRTNTQQQIIIEQGSYTQCPANNEIWKIKASSIKLDPNNNLGTAKHARLEIYNTPIAYIPYAQFPVGDERQSGLLFPALSDSNSGIDITLPYYLNFAPNFDATLSPRYKDGHGYLTELETRWLNSFDLWKISGAYIAADDSISSNTNVANSKRWLFNLEEKGALGNGFSTAIDYTKISDVDYLRDLNTTSLSINRATHLKQHAAFYYTGSHWSGGAHIQQHQTIDPNITTQNQPFKKLPELWLRYQAPNRPFHFNTNGHLRFSAFEHDALKDAQRSYGNFNLNYPMLWQGIQLTPEIGIEHISYAFDNNQTANQVSNLSYTAPQASLTLKFVAEKHSAKQTKTIEPTIQYRYKKVTDNANELTLFPSFDSDWLTVNKQTLLRASRFSGYDRIENTNQLAAALTHRVFNTHGTQVFAATMGQIIYFQDLIEQDSLAGATTPATYSKHNSAFIADFDAQLSPHWQSLGTVLWNSEENLIREGSFSLRYRGERKSALMSPALANLSYHFRGRDQQLTLLQNNIEQADISVVTPISQSLGLIGRYQYDLSLHSSIESLAGIEYNNCCIKLRFVYRDSLIYNVDDPGGSNSHDRSFFLQIQLKGLIGIGESLENLLQESIFGYQPHTNNH